MVVIIADNDALVRSVLRALLEDLGLDVVLAGDGEEAARYAGRVQAGLVLLDLNMPRMNGLLACEAIRALPGYESAPIAVLTALQPPRAEAAARRAGATMVLFKPFQPAALLQRLSPHLDIDRAASARVQRGAAQAREIRQSDPLRVREVVWARPAAPIATGPLDAARDRLSVYR